MSLDFFGIIIDIDTLVNSILSTLIAVIGSLIVLLLTVKFYLNKDRRFKIYTQNLDIILEFMEKMDDLQMEEDLINKQEFWDRLYRLVNKISLFIPTNLLDQIKLFFDEFDKNKTISGKIVAHLLLEFRREIQDNKKEVIPSFKRYILGD